MYLIFVKDLLNEVIINLKRYFIIDIVNVINLI